MTTDKTESNQKRLRKPISRQEMIDITLARFSGKPFKSINELAKEFNRDPAVISRAISQAFKRGLVQITPAKYYPKEPNRIAELERQLLDQFDQLSACLVIESQISSISPEADDMLHKELGSAMGAYIAKGSLFRDGDTIGLGSGRGVYYTIQGLTGHTALRAKVTLISLTGAVYARDHSEQMNLLLDADTHLSLLGRHFGRPITMHPLSHPIVYSNEEHLSEILANTNIGTKEWGKIPATHALVGVGVLSRGHRFYNEAKTEPSSRTAILRPIYKYLDNLVKLCDEAESKSEGEYFPVADICNRLFYVPSSQTLNMKEQRFKENVVALIEEINARLMTVTEEQLKQIDTIVLIAGTKKKAAAIRHLLSNGYNIRFLCTDQKAAEEILRGAH